MLVVLRYFVSAGQCDRVAGDFLLQVDTRSVFTEDEMSYRRGQSQGIQQL